MATRWRGRKAPPPRCWATRCAACAATRRPASTTTCWAARAARASSAAASSRAPSTAARTTAAARWTCTCGASASSAACASVGRRACWSSVSVPERHAGGGGYLKRGNVPRTPGLSRARLLSVFSMQACSPRSRSGWRRWRSSTRTSRRARPPWSRPRRLLRRRRRWTRSSRTWSTSWWRCRSSATRGRSWTGPESPWVGGCSRPGWRRGQTTRMENPRSTSRATWRSFKSYLFSTGANRFFFNFPNIFTMQENLQRTLNIKRDATS